MSFKFDKKKVVDVSGKPNKHKVAIVLLVVLAILVGIRLLTGFITDWMWFDEVGYVGVFFKKLFTQLEFGIPVFIVFSGLINLYFRRLKKGYFTKIVSHEATNLKRLNLLTNVLSMVFGAISAVYLAGGLWFQLLQFSHSTPFDIKDPLFKLDISFYLFKFDFLKGLNDAVIGLILMFIVFTVIYYMILITMHSPDVYEDGETVYRDEAQGGYGSAQNPFNKVYDTFNNMGKKRFSDSNFKELLHIGSTQLSLAGVLFFIMLGIHFFLKQFDLLHAHSGAVYGAGYTDVHVRLWVYRILIGLSLLGAVTIVHFIKKRDLKKIFAIPVIMIIVGVAGSGIAGLVQTLIVAPDEINKEQKYLANNIEYTQYAYNLNHVDTKSFAADNNLTVGDLAKNNETVSNIRINDYQPVKTFYNQTQSIRRYYKFNDIDVDRYNIENKYTQTYLSVRELDEDKINDTWLNRHLKYTHGYGLALSRVDQVTPSGQPDVLIKNIPPESSIPGMNVTRPDVYFGELSEDYIVVNTKEDEFNYPDGNSNKYSRYKGTAGIKLNPFTRLMFSMREQSLKLLVSSNINSKSKIIINRNVGDRVKKIMPYLRYEDDPYAVLIDGKIYWIVDGYTTSSYYPYSEPYDKSGTNYVRNSVKVVVDAYNGDVTFYVVDGKDPIAKTYQKIFPKLFKNFDDMPKELKAHIRYPNALFKIQADVYARYHMNDVKVFYQNEDLWDIAHEMYGTEEQTMKPNYYIAKLPGEEQAEFISVLPYTPKSKQNMTALMIARNDGKDYGKLVLYQFPKNKTVYGPMQIEAQIDQNTKISQDFSLWSQAGSKYSRGNLFVVPIENSLLYVEPIYLEASNSAIPEVKRVIVAYGDKIAYEPTLAEALEDLFGAGAGVESVVDNGEGGSAKAESAPSAQDYIKKASDAYENGQKALKDGDWSKYGQSMGELKDALDHLSKS